MREVDPELFFQRLIVFIQPEEMNDDFSYEVCSRQRSWFDKKGIINKAHKKTLKNDLFHLGQDTLSVLYLISF